MAQATEETVVRKQVRVQVPVERAFAVFVEQMETWWPAAHHIAPQPFKAIFVEPRVGGRWYELDGDGNQCDWGRVLSWNPPHSVTFSWHLGADWKFNPDMAFASEVEIRFSSDGSGGALVQLVHSHIDRHGPGHEKLRALYDGPGAWTNTLTEFAKAADENRL